MPPPACWAALLLLVLQRLIGSVLDKADALQQLDGADAGVQRHGLLTHGTRNLRTADLALRQKQQTGRLNVRCREVRGLRARIFK